MLQGLYFYEIILMIAGGVLFLALIFALIWYVIKGRKITALLPFFLLPIVMIGWPAIKSVSYDNGKIEIEKTASALIANPADTALQQKLQRSIATFDTTRAATDPVALNAISSAYFALGKYTDAGKYNRQALAIDPNLQAANNLKAGISQQVAIKNHFGQSIQQLDQTLAKGNTDPTAATKIVGILSNLKQPVYTDEKSILTIAKALAAVNKKEQSLQVVNKVLAANPQSTQTALLKQSIQTGKYNKLKADSAQTKKLETKKFNMVIKPTVPAKQ
jgi:tetratricopeptide (TPR) repeat protein